MPTYRVDVEMSAIVCIDVDAVNEQDALEEARQMRPSPTEWAGARNTADITSVRIAKDE